MRVRVASAGTGKTTSLVKRYLELIEEGVPLRRVAGVTFTRAAAAELRQRVAAGLREVLELGSYLGGLHVPGEAGLEPYRAATKELDGAVITTIHGFMRAGLKLNAPLLGLDPDFVMLAEWEAVELFEEQLASVRLLAADPDHELHHALLVAGDELFPLALELFGKRSLAEDLAFPDDPLSTALGLHYQEAYQRLLRRMGGGAMGPGEVERAALRLFASPVSRRRMVERFPVVLVDEYQDVNPLQGTFFERLAAEGARLEVVGDPKQSIYGFRSADVDVFRRALDAAQAGGELLEPLRESRRHSQALVAFLNRLTSRLSAAGLGFEPREAPMVSAAGSQASQPGAVRLLVAEGDVNHGEMRAFEAAMLAESLERVHVEQRVDYDAMAVVARANWHLSLVEEALGARGIPSLVLRGSGLFDRLEVRDVRHALQVGVQAAGPSFAAFLRGPFARLSLEDLTAVVAADEPLDELAARRPDVSQTVRELVKAARSSPLAALKTVTRSPIIAGRPYVDMLDDAARANVDAMLFELAQRTPSDLELLLDRLDDLATRSETAQVPESGAGVKLSTVHASKGLEYPVVAVFDAGAKGRDHPQAVLVDPASGRVALRAAGTDREAQARRSERDRHESFRLLYVAASRARDTLLISGSVSRSKPQGWLEQLLAMGFEAPEGEDVVPGVSVERRPWRPVAGGANAAPAASPGLPPSAWLERRFAHHRHGPLSSPSRLVGLLEEQAAGEAQAVLGSTAAADGEATANEPLTWAESLSVGDGQGAGYELGEGDQSGEDAAGGIVVDDLPGRGRVLGTLVHFAISRDWSAADDERMADLRTQEVMFPYTALQQDELMTEVKELLASYHAMVGSELPALSERLSDKAEIPLAFRGGPTVWEGVIDRLYRTKEGWFVDDYKTDRVVRPERYFVQLGLYLHAVSGALGERPRARLVYLRSRTTVEPEPAELADALARSGIVPGAAAPQ